MHIPNEIVTSDAFRALSYPARAMMVELCWQLSIVPNGEVDISQGTFRKLGYSPSTHMRARELLTLEGFIRPNRKPRSGRVTTCWVVWEMDDE